MRKLLRDISVGETFGRLVVTDVCRMMYGGQMRTMYRLKCRCGKTVLARATDLFRGKTVSCGCYIREIARRHGYTYADRLYRIWHGMKQRCYNRNNKKWCVYGGRGIVVCDEWKNDFLKFREWAIAHGYSESFSIDRIDSNGNYSPENCRWANSRQQTRNVRSNVFVEYNGERMVVSDLAARFSIKPNVLGWRIANGWDIERAVSEPVKNHSYPRIRRRRTVKKSEEAEVEMNASSKERNTDLPPVPGYDAGEDDGEIEK